MTDSPQQRSDTQALDSRPSTDERPPPGVLLDALADRLRRFALDALRNRKTPMQFDDLAREVAAREQEATDSDASARDAKRVRISLYHSHLPKLADAGVVEYDRDRGAVALSIDPERLEQFL